LRSEVEDGYRDPAAERAMQVRRGVAQVEEAADDEEVDDGAGVAFYVEDEVVCVA
jgi:hypothetical protein